MHELSPHTYKKYDLPLVSTKIITHLLHGLAIPSPHLREYIPQIHYKQTKGHTQGYLCSVIRNNKRLETSQVICV